MKYFQIMFIYVVALLATSVICENKYARSANEKNVKVEGVNFRTLEKPFRMNKLNLLWTKAQQVFGLDFKDM